MKKTLSIFSLSLLCTFLFGKERDYVKGIVSALSKYPNTIIYKTGFQVYNFEKINEEYISEDPITSFHLMWDGKELYLYKNGTGKLYRYDQTSFVRIDQTVYHGSNFGAINLINQDTIYSIGGYGFWNTSGAVKFFNKNTKEWYIHKSNQFVPVASGVNAIPFWDNTHKILYVLYNFSGPEYLSKDGENIRQILIQALDLKTKKWWDVPKILSNNIAEQISEIKDWIPTKHGLLAQTLKTPPLIIDFHNETIKILSESKLIELLHKRNKAYQTIDFYSDKGIHFYNPINDSTTTIDIHTDDLLKSNLDLSIKDKKPLKEAFYENAFAICILLLLIIIALTVIIIYTYSVSIQRKIKISTISNLGNYHDFVNGLMPIEWDLVKLIYNKSLENSKASAEEINNLLGLLNKPVKIQNNQRADSLFKLNEKFKIKLNKQEDLIIRERADFDKRLYEYSINKIFVEDLEKFFNEKSI